MKIVKSIRWDRSNREDGRYDWSKIFLCNNDDNDDSLPADYAFSKSVNELIN